MLITYEEFKRRADDVCAAMAAACAACGRNPAEVRLLPVTKTHPAGAVEYAARYGLTAVGENRVQEAVDKRAALRAGVGGPGDNAGASVNAGVLDNGLKVEWELIGHLQSNKAALAAAHFDRIQSVDSTKLVRRLGAAATEQGRRLRVLLQINSGADPAKFGAGLDEAASLLDAALTEPALAVEGLMTIAPLSDDATAADRAFAALRETRDRLAMSRGVALPELSMGMSGDFAAAIAAGSTLIRVGTALYGAR